MAKKTKKEIQAERKQKFMVLMMLIVAASMLLSGVYYINIGGRGTPTGQEDITAKLALIEQYKLEPIGNSSVIIEVKNITQDIIAIPDTQCMQLDNIIEIRNSSIDGVESISCEVANPSSDPRYSAICGSYIMFKFRVGSNYSGVMGRITSKLEGVLDEYSLRKGYMGKPPTNILGSGEIYVVGWEGTEVGDYVRIFLFTKDLITGGTGLIGLEDRNIPKGPRFPATVVNITGISVSGKIFGDFNSSVIVESLELNESEFNSRMPEFRVNGTLSKEDLDLITADVQETDNKTTIRFNSSKEEIEGILKGENLSYSLEPGAVFFNVPLNLSTEEIEILLTENGVENATFKKTGLVVMPREVMVDGRLVPINNYLGFGTSLYMDTEVGDKINISLSTITFGEQIIPFGASEFRNESQEFRNESQEFRNESQRE